MADGNKTERATPERRKKAREQGSVVRSRELPAVLASVGVVGVLSLLGHDGATHWITFYRELLDAAIEEPIQPNGPVLFWSALEVLRWIVPVLLGGLALSLAAQLAQGGLVFAPAALAFKPDRLNPATKLGQIFSLGGLSNLLKSMFPFAAMAWIGAWTLRSYWSEITSASSFDPGRLARFLSSAALTIGWRCGLVLLVWSAVEYLLTWQKMEGDMRMSREDLKDEAKQTDGNPAIKIRIRRLRRQMRKRQSLKAAKTATVVVTNPEHYAVALRYEEAMAAPIVVAKGLDLLAQEIKQIAAEHNIPTVENRPLAQALYKSVEVGDAIPSLLYQAVADILVIVYRAQAEVRAQEARRRSRNASGEIVQR